MQEFQCPCFAHRGDGVLSENQVIGMGAQTFAELLGSCHDLRADGEMHLVELLQATLNLPGVTVKKKDV